MGGPAGAFKARPVKSAGSRRKRVKSQKRRLLAGGFGEEDVQNMSIKEVREGLKQVRGRK